MDPEHAISETASKIGAAVERGIRTGEHLAANVYGYTDVDIEHLAWFIAGFTTTVSTAVSALLICDHILHLGQPELQVHVIRIAWMVPVYALDACFGLISNGYGWFWGSLRDIYEAFTIYSFLHLLFAMLDGEKNVIKMLTYKTALPALAPFCWCGEMQMGEVFFIRCKFGVLQYVLLKPICCLAEIITYSFGVYGGHQRFAWTEAYIYIAVVTNVSQMVALYSLLTFYQHMHKELARWNPLPKFACIKMVVFFTYWQGLVLGILQQYRVIRGTEYFTSRQVNNGLQNLCICVEMVVFAFVHHLVFDVKQFHDEPDHPVETPFWESVQQMFYIEKFRQDVKAMVRRSEYQKLNITGLFGGARYGAHVGNEDESDNLGPDEEGEGDNGMDDGLAPSTFKGRLTTGSYYQVYPSGPMAAPPGNVPTMVPAAPRPDGAWSPPISPGSDDRMAMTLDAYKTLRESAL